MNKTTGNPHSITVLSWHLSNEDAEPRTEPKGKSTKMEEWQNDLQLHLVPSLLLSAS